MVSTGSKTHFYGLLTLFWPILVGSPLHFGVPEACWGSKMGPKWPKRGPNWPQMAQKSVGTFPPFCETKWLEMALCPQVCGRPRTVSHGPSLPYGQTKGHYPTEAPPEGYRPNGLPNAILKHPLGPYKRDS